MQKLGRVECCGREEGGEERRGDRMKESEKVKGKSTNLSTFVMVK